MKKLQVPIVAVSILVLGFSVSTASAEWAAIAYSKSTGKYGSVNERSSQEEASKSALNSCGESDCEVVIADNDACIAVAVKNGVTGAGSAPLGVGRKSDAEALAEKNCQDCFQPHIVTSICSE